MTYKPYKFPLKIKILMATARFKRTVYEIKTGIRSSRSFCEFAFVMGYQHRKIPMLLRKVFAKTAFHRAWFSGYTGAGIVSVDERFCSSQY